MDNVILEIKDLKKYFPLANGKTVKAVDGVSMKLFKGETLGLVGVGLREKYHCLYSSRHVWRYRRRGSI